MLTGKRYRLENPTLALEIIDGRRSAITIPRGGIINVVSGPEHHGEDRTVKVLWNSKTVTMFAVDIEMRGTRIKQSEIPGAERSATA